MMAHLRAVALLCGVAAVFVLLGCYPVLIACGLGLLAMLAIYGMAYAAVNPDQSDTHGV